MNTTAIDVLPGLPVESLRDQLTGRLILPTDPEYDATRQVTRGDVDGHPAVIVRVANNDDVALAIKFARDNDLDIAVRSGGHSSSASSAPAVSG